MIIEELKILFLLVLVLSSLFFAVSVLVKRTSVADIFWGISFIAIASVSLARSENRSLVALVVWGMVMAWGARLSLHIFFRNRKQKEDPRYLAMTKSWGRLFFLRSYLQIFLLQGFLALAVSLPAILVILAGKDNYNFYSFVGMLIWLLGFWVESIADWQLKKFVKNPENKDKILTSGLWHYSRHPNYFGEVLMWWSIFLIMLSVVSDLGFRVLGVLGPLLITILITLVSGIPPAEKRLENNPEWEDYKMRTSALIPWFPKELKK